MDIVSQFLKTPSIKIYIGRNIKTLSASIKQTESTVHNQGANHILPNVPRRNYTDSLQFLPEGRNRAYTFQLILTPTRILKLGRDIIRSTQ